jgi:membrane-associated phospholipid phosphatase
MPASRSHPGLLRRFHDKFLVEERIQPAAAKRNLYIWSVALAAVGLASFLVILVDVLGKDGISVIDAPIEHWLDASRSGTVTVVMIGLAIVFGPIGLPIIVLVVVVTWGIVAKHAWRPLLLACGTLTGVIIVQIITRLVGRSRPPTSLMLFGIDRTYSFPSGHVLGACDFLLILTYLVFSRRTRRRTTVIAFAVAILLIFAAATSRVYLGYHWPTDALASMAISLVILGSVIAIDTHRTIRVNARDRVS